MTSALLRNGLCTSFTGLSLGSRKPSALPFSNGTISRCAMKTKTYHVQVTIGEDEPEENALKRFDRAVMATGLFEETKRRRYFEDSQDLKKRKIREAGLRRSKRRRFNQEAQTYDEVTAHALEIAPFADLFEQEEDIFAENEALLAKLTTEDIFGER